MQRNTLEYMRPDNPSLVKAIEDDCEKLFNSVLVSVGLVLVFSQEGQVEVLTGISISAAYEGISVC